MEKKRFWEIDALRGIAVVMMVLFNWLFALDYLRVYRTITDAEFWYYFARTTAALFILIAGVSLTLSSRASKLSYMQQIKRGLTIFSLGLIITLATWLFLGDNYVRFGILHLIGFSIILAHPFLKSRYWALFTGLVFVAAGLYLQGITFKFSSLEWLGFMPQNFYTVDYFPLLPWFGVFLIGVFAGNSLYEEGKRKYVLQDMSKSYVVRAFCYLGRNSLFIYLAHQPVLIAALYLLGVNIPIAG